MNRFKRNLTHYIVLALQRSGVNVDSDTYAELNDAFAEIDAMEAKLDALTAEVESLRNAGSKLDEENAQ